MPETIAMPIKLRGEPAGVEGGQETIAQSPYAAFEAGPVRLPSSPSQRRRKILRLAAAANCR